MDCQRTAFKETVREEEKNTVQEDTSAEKSIPGAAFSERRVFVCAFVCQPAVHSEDQQSPAESLGLLPVIWAHPLQVQVHRGPSVVINRAPLQVDRGLRSVP